MAYATITFSHEAQQSTVTAPVGFSWTVFFFGFITPVVRQDFKWAFWILVGSLLSFGLSNLIFAFIYNRLFIRQLDQQGFKAINVSDNQWDRVEHDLGELKKTTVILVGGQK